ncbi:MAG TPA: methyltransferase [Candidatus Nitrosotenuis sp.]|jgi:carbamoyltransferase|nr:methyltransferase [Candidatus Nitrosotenuis sp.]
MGEVLHRPIPVFLPGRQDRQELSFLAPAMARAGYDEAGVLELLGAPDIPFLDYRQLPGYVWLCRRENSPRAQMTALWLLNQAIAPEEARRVMGAEGVQALLRRGVLREEEGALTATVDLYPCQGAYVFTDRAISPVRIERHVYELGEDSYLLARLTPRRPVERCLDLCTGSGIHAVLAARHARDCTGVDINPRALSFARVNAALNGVDRKCAFLRGDLYQPVGQRQFDLITANPPFVPTPEEGMHRYRTGGRSGEEVIERIVAGLPRHLRPGGTFAMVMNYPIMRSSHYLDRLRRWLGGGEGWGVALLNYAELPLTFYVARHIRFLPDAQSYEREFEAWMESYAAHDIVKIGLGLVFARRLPAGRPGWAVERRIPMPGPGTASHVDTWLDALERYSDPDWTPDWSWAPALSPLVRRLALDPSDHSGLVELTDPAWGGPLHLEPEEALLAARLDGRTRAEQLAEELGRDKVRRLLRSLGQKELLK